MRAGDTVRVGELLDADPSLTNAADESGRTLLHEAASRSKLELVELLISRGADVNARTNDGRTPLHYAAGTQPVDGMIEEGYKLIISKAIEAANNPRYIDAAIMEALIANGADINAVTESRETPLHCAMSGPQAAVLISHGADVNARTENGSTLLHFTSDSSVARLAVQHGADVNALDENGLTPLIRQIDATVSDFDGIGVALIEAGADVNASDSTGRTALHYMALHPYAKVAPGTDLMGFSPLCESMERIFYALMAHGADLDAKTTAPSHHVLSPGAEWERHVDLPAGSTPKAVAKLCDNENVLELFGDPRRVRRRRVGPANRPPGKEHVLQFDEHGRPVQVPVMGSGMTFMQVEAARHDRAPNGARTHRGNSAIGRLLGKWTVTEQEETALQQAILRRDAGAVESMVRAKPRLARLKVKAGYSPLHNAVKVGDGSIAELLIAHGADPRARTYEGESVLHTLAAAGAEVEIAQLLIAHGANVNARDGLGWTCLHWAAKLGLPDFARRLLDNGADHSAKAHNGTTPLQVAEGYDQTAVAELLEQIGARE